jgi:hypothetical protein
MDVCLLWVFVLSGRGLCDGPSPRPEEYYRLWRVYECDQVKNKQPRYLLWVGRRGKDYKTKRNETFRIYHTQKDSYLMAAWMDEGLHMYTYITEFRILTSILWLRTHAKRGVKITHCKIFEAIAMNWTNTLANRTNDLLLSLYKTTLSHSLDDENLKLHRSENPESHPTEFLWFSW